jgi:branched-chain amino acid transport system substrate-binding protein
VPPAGRLRRVRACFLPVSLFLLIFAGCRLGEAPPPVAPVDPTEPVEMEGPALEDGPPEVDAARVAEAARLLVEGEQALEAGDAELALERVGEVERGFAGVPGTARALAVRARAHLLQEAWPEAEEAAQRYVARFPEAAPEAQEGLLLLVRSRFEGRLDGGFEALFRIRADAPEATLDRAEEVAMDAAERLELPVLRDLVREAPPHPRLLPAFQVELAIRRALMGDLAGSRELARAALELEPGPRVAERARALEEGRVDALEREAVAMGAILSEGGPPSLRALSGEIRSGVEVALAEAEVSGLPVRFQVLDDGASLDRVARHVEELERAGAAALLGPLEDDGLAAAARARRGTLPLLSPTARRVPAGAPHAFSLTGVDPAASRTLARAALEIGVRQVVVLHPRTEEMEEEAAYFRSAFEEGGGRILRTLVYPPGTTSFQEPFAEVVRIRPQGLVLILPPDEVGLIGPQVAFYGVDDLEDLVILGNDVWSSEGVLQSVSPRHTEGVVTVTARVDGSRFGPAWETFVERYEQQFQRTLRSPVPALGYDAARLLLQASREGGGTPEGTARALETIREFPGATGLLSIEDGRIQRRYTPVRIQDREPVPLRP